MKLHRYITIAITLFFIGATSTTFAQTFDDYKKKIREEYSAFEKETQQSFDDFVSRIDREFAGYLSGNFTSHSTEITKFQPEKPKPETPPVMEEEIVYSDNKIPYVMDNFQPVFQGPVYPGIQKSEDLNFDKKHIDVNFLGWPLYFDIDNSVENIKIHSISPEGISNYWTEMSSINYNHFLYQLGDVSGTLNLNQWAYYQLIKECSKQIYPGKENLQTLFQWFMLTRSRYKTRIGYTEDKLMLLLPSIYTIYNTDYITLNRTNYYVMDGSGEQLETYEKDFPEADLFMNMVIDRPLYTNEIKKSRDYNFAYNNVKHTVNLNYDEEMIKFYKTIPLSDIRIYFSSTVSNRTKESVKKAFTPLIKDLSETEAINLLLSFVQQAFPYKTDIYAYGKERYFFADEVLHYPFSDCEDRSVLFTYLVKTLLTNDVAAISFPGHMATVISTNEPVIGASLSYNNKIFIIADPTFTGAPAGMLMSTLQDKEATLIPFNIDYKLLESSNNIWDITNKHGGYKADRQNDIVINDGKTFVCGYYQSVANFDGITLNGEKNSRDAFITAYSKNMKPIWAIGTSGVGNNMAISLVMVDKTLYVYGSFEGRMKFGDYELSANNAPDVFVASINPENGNIFWIKKAGIDKLDHSSDFMFVVKFNPQGEKIMAKLYSQREDFDAYGLSSDENGNPLVVGSFFATTGMNSNDYTEYNIGNELDIPLVLYETDAKLKDNAYEATIAGLFSALNLIKANSIAIEGNDITAAFDKYNSSFSTYAKNIYNNMALMSFMKNQKGIITIKTADEKPIVFDKIKITNNTHIRVVKYKSGNILVEVLSGIYVGGGNHWLDMNSIKLFKETGDLLFNFDTDNSVKKVNLKKGLLKQN